MRAPLSTRAGRWSTLTVDRIGQDRMHYSVIAFFVAVTAATANWLHRDYLIATVAGYLMLWADLAAATLAVCFTFAFALRAWKERPRSPIALAKEVTLALFVPNRVAGLVLYLALGRLHGCLHDVQDPLALPQRFLGRPMARPARWPGARWGNNPGAFFSRFSDTRRSPA